MSELDILKNIIENKDKIFESINEAKEKLIPTVNIINILGNTYYEVSNSSLLHNLLKIKFKYENKEINFAKDFSLYIINNIHTENTEIDDAIIKYMLREHNIHIGEKTAEEIKINIGDAFKGDISKTMDIRGRDSINGLPKTETVNIAEVKDAIKDKIKDAKFENVYREFQTKDGRRIDILIVFDTFEIIIENKINAGDQENQLVDYYIDRNNGKLVFLVYLTRYGYKPSEFSINKELLEELENRICYLSHDDIAEWIENDILNKYQFLKEKEFQSIYSALIQIRDNEKIITNPSEEDNMQEKEIKKVLDEKLFKELESKGQLTKGKLNEYIEMFDKAKDLLEKQKIQILIKFTKEIANYLKSKNYKEGKDYTLLSDEDIINGMLKYNYPHPIEFNINNIRVSLEYEKYEGDMSCYFGIYTFNEDMPIKLREKFKASIESIFNYSNEYRNEYREEGAWIFIYYIDIEKDKSSKIAQAMIDLYELLKKEIK